MNEPNRIRLKICGMRLEENILQVANFVPDYMGFIFFKDSKRFVGENFKIPASLPSQIERVGVFVDQPVAEILTLAKKHRLDLIQLHGNESPESCNSIRGRGLKVIKVFSVGDDFDFHQVRAYKKDVDYFLFDTKGNWRGGNGVAFNWDLLKKYDQQIPFFLSGGIAPQNVSGLDKLRGMNLYAVDVNSGVEREAGVKDIGLIEDLISKINHDNEK